MNSSIVFTPAALVEFLSEIEELSDVEINFEQTSDDSMQITVGNSTYMISADAATDVAVSDKAVDAVEDINLDAFESLEDSWDVSVNESSTVQSGVLKEIAKTLLLGGLVRLSGKLLK